MIDLGLLLGFVYSGFRIFPAIIFFFGLLISPVNDVFSESVESEKGNLKIGQLIFDLSAYFGLEYNDNISAAEFGAEEDIIVSGGIDFNGTWDITAFNSLSFDFDISYVKYLEHSELDSAGNFFNVSPDSEISFNLLFGDFEVKVFDSLEYSLDPANSFGVDANNNVITTNLLKFGRFENVLGVSVFWEPIRDLATSVTLGREDLIPQDREFEFMRRTTYFLRLDAGYQINAKMEGGVYALFSTTSNKENFNNDSTGSIYGLYFNWEVSPFIRFESNISTNLRKFDSNGLNGDSSDSSRYNYVFSLYHDLNSTFSHRLFLSRSTELGSISNTNILDRVGYTFWYEGFNEIRLHGGVSWNSSSASGGRFREDADRFSYEIGIEHSFWKQSSYDLLYRNTSSDSNLFGRDFDRNQIIFRLRYDF